LSNRQKDDHRNEQSDEDNEQDQEDDVHGILQVVLGSVFDATKNKADYEHDDDQKDEGYVQSELPVHQLDEIAGVGVVVEIEQSVVVRKETVRHEVSLALQF
jgi:hypothetical protein